MKDTQGAFMDASRRGFLGGVCGAVCAATASGGEDEGGSTMARPRVILFDVNETLLDLTPLKESVEKGLGSRPVFTVSAEEAGGQLIVSLPARQGMMATPDGGIDVVQVLVEPYEEKPLQEWIR